MEAEARARGVYTPGIGGQNRGEEEEEEDCEECGGKRKKRLGREGRCAGRRTNGSFVGGFEVQRRRNRRGGGGPVQPARKRRGTNGHRGVASSSACQPALPEMLTVPREINATGEKKAVRVWWHTRLQVS